MFRRAGVDGWCCRVSTSAMRRRRSHFRKQSKKYRDGNSIFVLAEFQMPGFMRSKPDFDASIISFVKLTSDPFPPMIFNTTRGNDEKSRSRQRRRPVPARIDFCQVETKKARRNELPCSASIPTAVYCNSILKYRYRLCVGCIINNRDLQLFYSLSFSFKKLIMVKRLQIVME